MLRIEGLACSPLREPALRGVNLQVGGGQLVVVAGPSGSGKGTLCRCLSGLLRPERGRIELGGVPLKGRSWEVNRAGLVVLRRGRRVFPELTVLENLLAGSQPAAGRVTGGRPGVVFRLFPQRFAAERVSAERLDAVFRLFPQLSTRRRQAAGTLSGGEQQMVAIGRAMLAAPRVLVSEEPAFGLSPGLSAEVYRAFGAVREAGTAILLCEEDPRQALGYAQRAYVMAHGRMMWDGEPGDTLGRLESLTMLDEPGRFPLRAPLTG